MHLLRYALSSLFDEERLTITFHYRFIRITIILEQLLELWGFVSSQLNTP